VTTVGWLGDERATLASQRILDAAGRLFATTGAAGVGMADVAKAAGCSRATVYRYFESREALRTAFVHREAQRIGAAVAADLAGVSDPRRRLVEAMVASLRRVRDDPILMAWFTGGEEGLVTRLAQSSAVIEGLVAAFLGDGGDAVVRRRARWVIRVMVSLLVDPVVDESDERKLIEEFVVPVVVGPR
jgi:AcrR family transcriptional regulator